MQACANAESNPIHKKIVDQIVAVDNFMAFKKLMCKRNAELNKQAMAMLKKQQEELEAQEKKEGDKKEAPEEKAKNVEAIIKEQQEKLKNTTKLDKDMQQALKLA
jgi:hypothetical protein